MNTDSKKSIDWVIRMNESWVNDLSNDNNPDFILSDDPLVPIKKCTRCDYDKGFIVYTYNRWEEYSKKLSHFGMIRCNRCGQSITWIPKEGRDILIKKHNIDLNCNEPLYSSKSKTTSHL